MDSGTPIVVWQIAGARRVQRWQHGHVASHDCAHVAVGRLPDGRWFAEYGPRARAYPNEEIARGVAGRLMGQREGWQEVPAEPGSRGGLPPAGWRRSGQTWLSPPDATDSGDSAPVDGLLRGRRPGDSGPAGPC